MTYATQIQIRVLLSKRYIQLQRYIGCSKKTRYTRQSHTHYIKIHKSQHKALEFKFITGKCGRKSNKFYYITVTLVESNLHNVNL